LKFYLGTHILNHIDRTNVPLFVSIRQLMKRVKKPFQQSGPLCIDSGGFSELSLNGEWSISPQQYVDELRRCRDVLGLEIEWAACQDWMCEPQITKKTGKTIKEHQWFTVKNYIFLTTICTDIHIIPVLQGQTLQDYYDHIEMYDLAMVDLRSLPVVGIGSVCRRQNTDEIGHIIKSLAAKGLNLHGFGVKKQGLERYGEYLVSADSMAWSFGARYSEKCFMCVNNKNKNCANCLNYAMMWRDKLL